MFACKKSTECLHLLLKSDLMNESQPNFVCPTA